MRNNLKLCSLAFSRRNRPFWITAVLIFIIVTLQCTSISIFRFHQLRLTHARSDVYGYFYVIAYQTPEEYDNSQEDSTIGIINVTQMQTDSGLTVRIGTYNPAAKNLIYQGKEDISLPGEINHCLISRSLANKENASDYSLSIESVPLMPDRILPDLGYLWSKGEREEALGMNLPNIWVNSDTYTLFSNSADSTLTYRIVLLDAAHAEQWNDGYLSLSGDVYRNTAATLDQNLQTYKIDSDFIMVQLLLLVGILILLFIGYCHYASYRYIVYADLGLTDSRLKTLICTEFAFVSILPFLAGFAAAGIIVSILTRFLYPGIYVFSFVRYYGFLKNYIITFLFGFLLCLLLSALRKGYKSSCGRFNTSRYILPVKGRMYLVASAPLLFLLEYTLLAIFGSFANINYQQKSLASDYYGQINKNYDFEITYQNFSIANKQYMRGSQLITAEDSPYVSIPFAFRNHSGKLDDLLSQMQSIEAVSNVETFSENSGAFMAVSEATASSRFSEISYFTFYFPEGPFTSKYQPEINTAMKRCDICAFSDNYLSSIAQQMGVSPDSLSSVLSGDSVLLVAPSYRIISESEDGGVLYTRDFEGENLLTDPDLDTYSFVRIFVPQASTNLEGFIPQETLVSLGASLKVLDLPVAGKTNKNLGWFNTSYTDAAYRILVSERFFDRYPIWHETTRMRIFLKDNADAEAVSLQIQNSLSDIPNIRFTDRHHDMEVWHEYQLVERIIYILYFLLSLCLITAFSLSVSYCYWLANEQNASLYRDLGITVSRLFHCLAIPFLLITLLFFVMQILFGQFVLSALIFGWSDIPSVIRIALQAAVFAIYAVLFAAVLGIRTRELFRRQDYSE